jgi:hypothetical protein
MRILDLVGNLSNILAKHYYFRSLYLGNQPAGRVSRPGRHSSKSEGGRRNPPVCADEGWITLSLIRPSFDEIVGRTPAQPNED